MPQGWLICHPGRPIYVVEMSLMLFLPTSSSPPFHKLPPAAFVDRFTRFNVVLIFDEGLYDNLTIVFEAVCQVTEARICSSKAFKMDCIWCGRGAVWRTAPCTVSDEPRASLLRVHMHMPLAAISVKSWHCPRFLEWPRARAKRGIDIRNNYTLTYSTICVSYWLLIVGYSFSLIWIVSTGAKYLQVCYYLVDLLWLDPLEVDFLLSLVS